MATSETPGESGVKRAREETADSTSPTSVPAPVDKKTHAAAEAVFGSSFAAAAGANGGGTASSSLASAWGAAPTTTSAWGAPAASAWGVAAAGSNPWLTGGGGGGDALPTLTFTAAWGSSAPLGDGAGAAMGAGGGASHKSDDEAEGGEEEEDASTAVPIIGGGGGGGGPAAPPPPPPPTGEELEVTLVQVRAKLFYAERAGAAAGSSVHGGEGDAVGDAAPSLRWRECGVGPLRINIRRDLARFLPPSYVQAAGASSANLGSTTVGTALAHAAAETAPAEPLQGPPARIVMRQEHHTGGRGSRLLLNASLARDVTASMHPQQDRTVSLVALAPAPPRMGASAPVAVSGGGEAATGEGGEASSDAGGGGSESGEAGDSTWALRAFLVKCSKSEHARELLAAIAQARALCERSTTV